MSPCVTVIVGEGSYHGKGAYVRDRFIGLSVFCSRNQAKDHGCMVPRRAAENKILKKKLKKTLLAGLHTI